MHAGIDLLIIDDSDADVRDTLLAVRNSVRQPAITRLKDIPIVHGIELLRRLRRVPATREIPIVVLTASRNPVVMEEAYLLGARECLSKPFDRSVYVAEVAKLVSRWLGSYPKQS